MKTLPQLEPGLSGMAVQRVEESSTARHLGSGAVEVLATPELVRLMEVAAVAALAGILPPDLTTVGVAIEVQHIAATPVGMNVEVRAVLREVQGRRLHFQIVARDDVEEIGRGMHQRVLVEKDRFAVKAKSKLQ